MSAIRAKNTGPEVLLRKTLYKLGLIGYRLHWQKAPGRPDICYVAKKIAIFVHGCYWHRCPYCKLRLPKSHSTFWKRKFMENIKRDRTKTDALRIGGWKTLVLWECQVNNRMKNCIIKIKRLFKN
jgi:DNA mismatch endonuclease (patch repair protein)